MCLCLDKKENYMFWWNKMCSSLHLYIYIYIYIYIFVVINDGILLMKNPVHRVCTWITVHQTPKLQWSSISKKLEQGKRLKDERHSSKRRDLSSEIIRSFPLKHLEFCSSQIHHKTQCGTALHKSMLWCPPKEPCLLESKSVTLCSIAHRRPNRVHTIDHNS